jgi:hypothetical protein
MSGSDSPYDVTILIAADPDGTWKLPSLEGVLTAIKNRVVDAAMGRYKIAEQFYDQIKEYKRLKNH